MDKPLRAALERRGLDPAADERTAQDFYARLPLDEKARLGEELGREAYEANSQLQTRDAPVTRDLTTRALQLRAATVKQEERSVEAILSTEMQVEVYDWRRGEVVDEVLLVSGAQLPAQMPLLANHSRYSLDDVLGSIRGIKPDSGQIVGRLHFAADEMAERAWQKVRAGHITDVSVGYRVTEATEIAPGQMAVVAGQSYTAGKRTLRVATKWQPKEVSLVPIGADQAAKIREDSQPLVTKDPTMNRRLRAYLETIGLRREATDAEAQAYLAQLSPDQRARADAAAADPPPVPQPAPTPPPTPPTPPAPVRTDPTPEAIRQQAVAAERDRVRQLTELAGADVPAAIRERAIAEGWDVARASQEFLTTVRGLRQPGQNAPAPYVPSAHTGPIGGDAAVNARSLAAGMLVGDNVRGMERAMMHTGRRDPNPSDVLTPRDLEAGHRLRRLSVIDLARECAFLDTGRRFLDVDDAFDAERSAPSGGTLAYVFTTNMYAKLIEGWEEEPDTTVWCDEEDVPNFLTQEDISLNAKTSLDRHTRGGKAQDATIADSHETYKIARYSKQFTADDQDIIDDRFGAIMRMPAEMGKAARRLRPDLVYAILLANPALVADSGKLFNSTAITTAGGHANLGSAALEKSSLQAGITAMQSQYRLEGDKKIALNVRPKWLMVPSDLEWTARELTTSGQAAQTGTSAAVTTYIPVNLIAAERLGVVVEGRLSTMGVTDPVTGKAYAGNATNWYLSAGGPRTVRVAYLRGTGRKPQLRSFVLDRGQWGLGWDIKLDIGAAAMDFVGLYKSTGGS